MLIPQSSVFNDLEHEPSLYWTTLDPKTAWSNDNLEALRAGTIAIQVIGIGGRDDADTDLVQIWVKSHSTPTTAGYNGDTDWKPLAPTVVWADDVPSSANATYARLQPASLVPVTDLGKLASLWIKLTDTASDEGAGDWYKIPVTNPEDGIVLNGNNNVSEGQHSAVMAGVANSASGVRASVTGGQMNLASGTDSAVVGGATNEATATESTVVGGGGNTASGTLSIVAGGGAGTASAENSSVVGGLTGTASGARSSVMGGNGNTASGGNAVVAGGALHVASADNSGAFAGYDAVVSGQRSVVVGGNNHAVSAADSAAVAGTNGSVGGPRSAIVGGNNNDNDGDDSVILGGNSNFIDLTSADCAIIGGKYNNVNGIGSIAIGHKVNNFHQYAVLINCDPNGNYNTDTGLFESASNSEFAVRAGGGFRFLTNAAESTGVTMAGGASSWSAVSDRDTKDNIVYLEEDVLEGYRDMRYASYDQGDDHVGVGVIAQDWYQTHNLPTVHRVGNMLAISQAERDGLQDMAITQLVRLVDVLMIEIDSLWNEIEKLKSEAANEKFRKDW